MKEERREMWREDLREDCSTDGVGTVVMQRRGVDYGREGWTEELGRRREKRGLEGRGARCEGI